MCSASPDGSAGPGDLHRRPRGPPRPQEPRRRFDGYKAHLSIDPDSELIDDVMVTPANAADATPSSTCWPPAVDDEEARPGRP